MYYGRMEQLSEKMPVAAKEIYGPDAMEVDPLTALSNALSFGQHKRIKPEQLPPMSWDIFRARREEDIDGPAHRRLMLKAKEGDIYALEQLWVSAQPIVSRAATMAKCRLSVDEREEAAMPAVLGAIQRFNMHQDETKLSTFIETRVRGSIQDEGRSENVWRGISRHDNQKLEMLRELIEADEITPEQANDILHGYMARNKFPIGRALFTAEGEKIIKFHMSTDSRIGDKEAHKEELAIRDTLDDRRLEEALAEVEDRTHIESQLADLPPREKLILVYTLGLYGQAIYSQREISQMLGLDHSRISQLRTQALGRLRLAYRLEQSRT